MAAIYLLTLSTIPRQQLHVPDENLFMQIIFLARKPVFFTKLTRLKGFSPKREQRLWKIFQISGRDSKVRAKMTIKNFYTK